MWLQIMSAYMYCPVTVMANDTGVPEAGGFVNELARHVHPFCAMA